jgi:hypothetical protein
LVDAWLLPLPQILSLPSSLAYPLFHKLASKGDERVAPGALLQWASAHNLCGSPEARRAFDILRQVKLVAALRPNAWGWLGRWPVF